MNAEFHARLSTKAAKTESQKDFDFFYKIHDFIDSSKELEASNLHRTLTHHLWFVKRVIIPIFGHTYICENGKSINIKDDQEKYHLLSDFSNKFIPSLSDYVDLIKDDKTDEERFKDFQKENNEFFDLNPEIKELMLSPLSNTGQIKSLWITHNSWFVGQILPMLYKNIKFNIKNYSQFAPSIMFNRMRFDNWIQNELDFPPSFLKIKEYRERKIVKFRDTVLDGSRANWPKEIHPGPEIFPVSMSKEMLD